MLTLGCVVFKGIRIDSLYLGTVKLLCCMSIKTSFSWPLVPTKIISWIFEKSEDKYEKPTENVNVAICRPFSFTVVESRVDGCGICQRHRRNQVRFIPKSCYFHSFGRFLQGIVNNAREIMKRFPINTRRYDIKWITTILLLLLFFGWFGEWSILFYFLKGATLRRKWVVGLSRLEWCVAQSRVGPFPLPEIFGLDQLERFDLPSMEIKVPAMQLQMPVSLKTLQHPKTNGIRKCRPFNRFQTKTQTWLRSIFSTSFILIHRVPMREKDVCVVWHPAQQIWYNIRRA